MKVKKVTRKDDYVRFSFDVEVEDKGLDITLNFYGGLGRTTINGIKYNIIDDVEMDVRVKMFGEEVKMQGFKEMYNTLFKKDYKEFEDKLYDIGFEELKTNIPDLFENVGIYKKANILLQMLTMEIGEYEVLKSHHNMTYLISMFEEFKNIKKVRHTNASGNIYGFKYEDVIYMTSVLRNIISCKQNTTCN